MGRPPGGYFGRALIADLSTGQSSVLAIEESVLRSFIGGAGLGTWLMHECCPAGVDPLAAEAPLMFVFSPLVGTPLTTSAKFAVLAKSPLTGRLTDALASSHFAIAGKLTGHDAIVVRGCCPGPSVLIVDGSSTRVAPAEDLWGLSAADAEAQLRERMGPAWRVAAIGRAGEHLVRYATISHDGRHAGRGGLGAVMGSKWLKAVMVRPSRKVASADPPAVLAAAKALRERSFGQATAKHRELGTMANLLAFNATSTLPTRNFQEASFEGAEALGAEQVAELRQVARSSCASCSIGCAHLYKGPKGKKTRMEYENVFALGSLCGVGDPDQVIEASALCDELGLDTISAGGTIAWAMECAEKELIDAPWLRFGDGAALLRVLREIGSREGIGDLLAEGSRSASRLVGRGSGAFAAHVKGLELPGYEPRTLQSMALGLAVNARGADHNRSGAYEADLSGEHDRLVGGEPHVRGAIETEDRAAVMDSLILCKFLRGAFDDPLPEWARLLNAVTGWDVDGDELERTARRIVMAKRLFNVREGWTREEDWLPDRFVSESLELESGRTATLTPDRLRSMIDSYYRGRGLRDTGLPTPETLGELDLAGLGSAGGLSQIGLSDDDQVESRGGARIDPVTRFDKRDELIVHEQEPFNAETDRASLISSVTATDAFYVRGHGAVPELDPDTWRLRVEGLVDRKLDLSLETLREAFVERTLTATLQCAGNRRAGLVAVRDIPGEAPWGPGATGTATWTGVALADVLALAGPRPDAAHVGFEGADLSPEAKPAQLFGGSVPLDKAHRPEVLLAWAMNGEPLAPVHGAPIRVVVPGYIGARSVKWLTRVELRSMPWPGYFQDVVYRLLAPEQTIGPGIGMPLGLVALNSDVLAPRDGADVPAGEVEVRGYAFAGGDRHITRVDVSTDDGRSWRQAELLDDLGRWAWRHWQITLELPPGEHRIVVRAWDSSAATQPEDEAALWNPKGYVNNARPHISVTAVA